MRHFAALVFSSAGRLRPISVLVLSFAGLIVVGTGVLMLPEASTGPSISLVDAVFTATSAVCVTGLAVTDTGSTLTLLGQATVMMLMQLGGLGIMTFSTLILLLMGRRLSFGTHGIIAQSQSGESRFDMWRTLVDIVVFTFAIELIGFVLLAIGFADYMTLKKALWWAAFHSVSAFCNGGFSLSAQSLVPFQTDWFISLTIGGLIILGGLGFVVIAEISSRAASPGTLFRRRRGQPFSLHTKIVLAVTAVLIIGGAAYIFVMESMDSLTGRPVDERILISLFQSITARTAGFNSMDMAHLSNATVFILIGLMFFGASPGSCGGGVKTTALATIYAIARARLTGEPRERLFKRSLPQEAVNSCLALVFGSVLVVGLLTVLLYSFMPETQDRGQFVAVMFEAVSAFGTVGLSLGVTESLNPAAKTVVITLMFIGRLGPLTMMRFLSVEPGPEKYRYAEESYMVG